ncbi:germacrene A synthase-like [Andrographis paniculata]|uniref:germacrene A synthase-like n=1 Tax=Andrographis paniculata TaxID=175694 RepID=UPI0021E97AC3|nr:germacrene A synthase-like [Andrographis paniculata]QJA18353.1 terpene synthase 38 [Andrographis paniculata]
MAEKHVNNLGKEVGDHRCVVGNFPPSLWGDLFLGYAPNNQLMQEYLKEIEVLKDKVKSMLTTPTQTMELIDIIEHLCLSYHFEDEIEDKLEKYFNLDVDYIYEAYDLHTVALHFRLFRAHGYHMLPDVFSKFKDDIGNFQEALKSDTRGLLSLYEAAHLWIHGEDILDEALVFATSNLKSATQNLDSPIKEEVEHALAQPLHLSIPRVNARKWWKELDVPSTLPYARDRVVECYFFSLGTYHEPQYSHCRVLLTKVIATLSILDDTYDSYGTTEELNVITNAIQRWDVNQIDHVPDYFKSFYKALLELYNKFEEELEARGQSYAIYYAKENVERQIRGDKATGIGCYAEEKCVLVEETIDKFYEVAKDAWKDMNEEILKPSTHSRDVLTRILNLARVVEVLYNSNQDGYTLPKRVLEPHIKSLLADPIII